MLVIEDECHAEPQGVFPTFEEALAELRRVAKIPWDQKPNRAPCKGWRTCGRYYEIIEYNSACEELRSVAVLNVSAHGIEWQGDFENSNS